MTEFSEAWQEGDDTARWQTEFSEAWQEGDDTARWRSTPGWRPGGLALVPKCVSHEVRNAGDGTLRFVAAYAEPEVVTTYEREVQPDGSRERQTVG